MYFCLDKFIKNYLTFWAALQGLLPQKIDICIKLNFFLWKIG